MPALVAGSVMTIHRHPCTSPPVGAWRARSRHSSTTPSSTGLARSSRRRTARVVDSTHSMLPGSAIWSEGSRARADDPVRLQLRLFLGGHAHSGQDLLVVLAEQRGGSPEPRRGPAGVAHGPSGEPLGP